MLNDKELVAVARLAAENAYVPYSHFPVGAALQCPDGKVFTGCNVENAAYGSTICAERTAICKAVSEGYRKFSHIAIWGKGDDYCMPCGACRQFMVEFGSGLEVIVARGDGEFIKLPLPELLPYAFNTENLK